LPAAGIARVAGFGLRVPRADPAPDRPGALRRRSRGCVHRRGTIAPGLWALLQTRATALWHRGDRRLHGRADARHLKLFPFCGSGRRLGCHYRLASRLRPSREADRYSRQPAGGPARSAAYRRCAGGREGLRRAARAVAARRDRLSVDSGNAAADARPSGSPTRRPASPPGSSKSFAPGPIAAAMSRPHSPATNCSPISASTGSPARSVRHSGHTTRVRIGRGPFPKGGPSMSRPDMRSFRVRSCVHPARWRREPTPTSGAGASCRAAVISLHWSSRKRSSMRYANSSGPCAASDRTSAILLQLLRQRCDGGVDQCSTALLVELGDNDLARGRNRDIHSDGTDLSERLGFFLCDPLLRQPTTPL